MFLHKNAFLCRSAADIKFITMNKISRPWILTMLTTALPPQVCTYCNSKHCNLRFFKHTNPHVINGPCELMEGIKTNGMWMEFGSEQRWLRLKKRRFSWCEDDLKSHLNTETLLFTGSWLLISFISSCEDTQKLLLQLTTWESILPGWCHQSQMLDLKQTWLIVLWEVKSICDLPVYGGSETESCWLTYFTNFYITQPHFVKTLQYLRKTISILNLFCF